MNTCTTNINFQDALIKLNHKLGKEKYIHDIVSIKLSEIEYKILFLLYLRQSYSDISQIMTKLGKAPLCGNTVFHLICRLRQKFEVNSDSKLIEKAILSNVLTTIPAEFAC